LLAPPPDIDLAQLNEALNDRWRVDVASLVYAPLGAGSHHWIATETTGQRWFVTVDDLCAGQFGGDPDAAFAAYATAYHSAAALRDAGLEFVLPPVADLGGALIHRLGPHFSMIVLPFVEGETFGWGGYRNERDRQDILRHLARLHSVDVPPVLTRREDFAVPKRAELVEALQRPGDAWTTGPFGELARQLLLANEDNLRAAFNWYDTLVAAASASTEPWVVTHGEPHAGNVIRDRQDRLLLFDWDTVAVGPRERDLWMLVGDDVADLDAYDAGGGSVGVSGSVVWLYRLWWELADIALYTADLRAAHDRDENTEASWRVLSRGLPIRTELLG